MGITTANVVVKYCSIQIRNMIHILAGLHLIVQSLKILSVTKRTGQSEWHEPKLCATNAAVTWDTGSMTDLAKRRVNDTVSIQPRWILNKTREPLINS